MKKIFFSICLLMPLCLNNMERQFPEDSKKQVEAFEDLCWPTKESNDRVILALAETRMNGSCNAFKGVDREIKLEFSDIDPKRDKKYVCSLQLANKKIRDEVNYFKALLKKEGHQNNCYYSEHLSNEKLARDPFMFISEDTLKKVQIERYIRFINNDDLNAHLQNAEESLQYNADDLTEIQNSRKLAFQNTKAQIDQIVFNRIILHLAFTAGDLKSINDAKSKQLHITPYVPFLECMDNLRKAAASKTIHI